MTLSQRYGVVPNVGYASSHQGFVRSARVVVIFSHYGYLDEDRDWMFEHNYCGDN